MSTINIDRRGVPKVARNGRVYTSGTAGNFTSSGAGSTAPPAGSHLRQHSLYSDTDHGGTGGDEKATPVDADSLVLIDSADSSKIKRTTLAHLKTVLGVFWTRAGTILSPAIAGDSIRTTGEVQGSALISVDNADSSNQSSLQPSGIMSMAKYVNIDWRTYINPSEPAAGTELYKRFVQYFKSPTFYNQFKELLTVAGTWTTSSRPVQWVIQTVVTGATTLSDRIKILASGSFQIGNDTNNMTIDLDGKVRLNGTATVWKDIRTAGLAAKIDVGNSPVMGVFQGATQILTFAGDALNAVFITVQLPHEWKEGSSIEPHVHWSPMTSPATTLNVIWKMEYTWSNYLGTFGATTTLTATGATGTTGFKHLISPFPVIDGTGKTISSILVVRLYRDGTNAADTYTGFAGLLEFDIHIECDALGSDTEYAK